MNGDKAMTANFALLTYAVTVSSAGTGATGGGNYAQGATVSISAGTPPSGQQFVNWTVTGGGVTLANANSSSTTFTMPANAVMVTADFAVAFTDARDSKVYKMVTIGSQTWMAENLNYETSDSWCYGGDESNCATYGSLYTWDAAMTACPTGWHLPTYQEWGVLVVAAGGTASGTSSTGAPNLKDQSWDSGTNSLGFSALPGGFRYYDGSFYNLGSQGVWWTANVHNVTTAYRWTMSTSNTYVLVESLYKSSGLSVRCLMDD
jgi:uncharacterized protein (TIGR02145 family)